MLLALAGGAEPLDLLGAPVNDEVVLDAVALLLAAVELSLPLGILGTLDGARHSVNDELESLAAELGQKRTPLGLDMAPVHPTPPSARPAPVKVATTTPRRWATVLQEVCFKRATPKIWLRI